MTTALNILMITTSSIYCIGLLFFFTGLFLPNRKRQNEKPVISIIIAARNEENHIEHILGDLMNQTYPKNKVEIIIVNDHSEDATGQIVETISKKDHRIKYFNVTKTEEGLTAKKNAIFQGIRNSRGEIILTTDADCRVLPTWMETMVSYFEPDVGMVVGFSQLGRKGEKRTLFQKLQAIDFLSLMSAAQGSLNLNWPLAASGQNLAYRRSAFEEVDGFKEIGHRISGDDVLLLQLIHQKTSWKIRFAPSQQCYNTSEPETSIHDFFNQRKRWASNGSYQIRLNRLFFFFVIMTFLVNASLLIGACMVLIFSKSATLLMTSLIIKLCVEGFLIWKGCSIYRRFDLFKIFPLWFVLQIPYVFLVGLLGTIGQFTWKNRIHSPSYSTKK
ncbi:glycosyltransferase [bacterium]|nr:glycosyltransferase [bacterium]